MPQVVHHHHHHHHIPGLTLGIGLALASGLALAAGLALATGLSEATGLMEASGLVDASAGNKPHVRLSTKHTHSHSHTRNRILNLISSPPWNAHFFSFGIIAAGEMGLEKTPTYIEAFLGLPFWHC